MPVSHRLKTDRWDSLAGSRNQTPPQCWTMAVGRPDQSAAIAGKHLATRTDRRAELHELLPAVADQQPTRPLVHQQLACYSLRTVPQARHPGREVVGESSEASPFDLVTRDWACAHALALQALLALARTYHTCRCI